MFIAVALLTVALLEYIDFRKGKKSFIFTTLIPLKKVSKKVDTFNGDFIRILNKNNITYDYSQDVDKKYHFQLDVDAGLYKGLMGKLEGITAKLKGKIELVEVQGMDNKSMMLYKVLLDGKTTHLVLITKIKKVKSRRPQEEEVKEEKPKEEKTPAARTPKLAFIIDDIGAYDIGALELKRLNIPITASVLPDSPHAREEARWLREYGIPMLLHIPMEPKNGNGQTYLRSGTITMQSSDEEIRHLIRRAKEIAPGAIGVNNHQGSLVTTSSSVMTRTLKIIKEEGLFFIDSRTIGNTVAYDIAKRLGLKTAYKDVFIDHIKDYSHSVSQIRRLVEIALQKGKAITIGHPHDSTIRAIRDSIKFIRAKGVRIVYVSELLE